MLLLYKLVSTLIFPFYVTASLLSRRLTHAELTERIGFAAGGVRTGRPVWIHGASVGEMSACVPLVREIKKRYPAMDVVVSTMTRAGKDVAGKRIPGAAEIFLAPVDVTFCVRTALRRISPRAIIILETEIWPNLLSEAKKAGVKVAFANGRLSAKSVTRYLLFGRVVRRLLSGIDAAAVQTENDMKRFVSLGVRDDVVKVLGNMKDDLLEPREVVAAARTEVKARLDIGSGRKVAVAGSTRPGEEEEVITGFIKIKKRFPDSLLVLAPRHMKRIGRVEKILSRSGMSFRNRTSLCADSIARFDVLLLDTMGELGDFFWAADVSFVGGTLRPFGGHNVLEPAALGIPVAFGPHCDKCEDAASSLAATGGGRVVRNGAELGDVWLEWLSDEKARRRAGGCAVQAVLNRKGASARTVSFLADRGILT